MHCVIVGFTKDRAGKPRLFNYTDINGEPHEVPVRTAINAYLIDGPNVLVEKRMRPLSEVEPARFGSKPVDGGNLIVEQEDYATFAADPVASKYLRPFRMGKELIHGLDRWCLWLEDLNPADLTTSALLKDRLENCRKFRLKSRKIQTQDAANTPHLFGEIHQPNDKYLGIPRVFSETRRWATCAWLPPEVIAGDKVYTCIDPDGFAFALISSSMFITWQKTTKVRLQFL